MSKSLTRATRRGKGNHAHVQFALTVFQEACVCTIMLSISMLTVKVSANGGRPQTPDTASIAGLYFDPDFLILEPPPGGNASSRPICRVCLCKDAQ